MNKMNEATFLFKSEKRQMRDEGGPEKHFYFIWPKYHSSFVTDSSCWSEGIRIVISCEMVWWLAIQIKYQTVFCFY